MTENEILNLPRYKRPICRYSVIKRWSAVPWECHHRAKTVYDGLPFCATHARILRKQKGQG